MSAALATWNGPRAAAKLAEALRRDAERSQERQRNKLHVFASLMQERAAIYSEAGVRALNIIDVVFHDSLTVREAWAELYLTFSLNPIPPHVLEEHLRKLLAAMAIDIGLGDKLKTDDFGREYNPRPITQERFIRDMQREQLAATLLGQHPLQIPRPPKRLCGRLDRSDFWAELINPGTRPIGGFATVRRPA